MEDFYYRVTTDRCSYVTYRRNEAFEYYERNAGQKIETITKDLFPEIRVLIDEANFNLERIRGDLTIKKTSEALRKAIDRYDKDNTVQYKIKLNRKVDSDIIAYLDTLSNKQGFIKELIREHIKNAKHY